VRVPDVSALNAVGQVILLSEASAVMEPYVDHRDRFGADVMMRLDQGRLIPATDYINAQRIRRRLRIEFGRLWSEVDCVLMPTTPITAPRIGENTIRLGGRDEDARLATTRLVRGINVLGLPALSLPCGLSGAGLPVGLQIVGSAFDEATILRVGAALEDGGVGIPPCPMV
jgi:aspartyl-tRNA(Asn)/glutamyl-tRNA(Gln) amidotransferase subunit A